jgi:DNA-binding MarR family transcriptional regulator
MSRSDEYYEIMKQFRAISENFRALKNIQFKSTEMTGTQGFMVSLIAHRGMMTISELSQNMNLSTSTVSEMVSRIEKSGILVRKRDTVDRRIVRVDISDPYKIKFKDHFSQFKDFLDTIFTQATDVELEEIKVGLGTLLRFLEPKDENDKESNQ